MSARYIIRFDDITPTMDWDRWAQIEPVLDRWSVRPLLAVVPDNADGSLDVATPVLDFWDRVRAWQRRGWAIGLHGYQHRYERQDGGILDLHNSSEFAGLPIEEQRRKIQAGLEIFRQEGVRADSWVAPGHSFDRSTLHALSDEGLDVISDGFGLRPTRDDDGLVWVPQQLWWFRPRPIGTWTVCLHHNAWSDSDAARFEADVERYRTRITSFDATVAAGRAQRRSRCDMAYGGTQRRLLITKRRLAGRLRRGPESS